MESQLIANDHAHAANIVTANENIINPRAQYTTAQAALLLGYSKRTLEKWRSDKVGIKFIQRTKNGKVSYLGSALIEFREKNQVSVFDV